MVTTRDVSKAFRRLPLADTDTWRVRCAVGERVYRSRAAEMGMVQSPAHLDLIMRVLRPALLGAYRGSNPVELITYVDDQLFVAGQGDEAWIA